MQSLLRRVFTLGLLSSSLLFGPFVTPRALALSEEEVLRKLAAVPAFVVATEEGAYITNRLVGRSEDTGEESEVALLYVFFNGQDAEEFLTLQRQENPNFNQSALVGWVELSALYQQAQTERDIPLRLLFVPEGEELSAATELNSDFSAGVPLFLPKYKEDGSYVPISVDGEPVVPAFFSQQDLEGILAQQEETQPGIRDRIEIEVLSLEALIREMEESNDENLNLIYLFPDSEAINYIRANRT
ncbi:MAG: hypothetical protein F6J97_00330 [Leptolyngbya sp. SIO4C1]|nr:hypothetical protein [Leptolyngbya sp. SIO4C1]